MPATQTTLRFAVILLCLAGCAGGGSTPPLGGLPMQYPAGRSDVPLTLADRAAGGACAVSADGFLWYALPSGTYPPIDFAHVRCAAPGTLAADTAPPMPQWSQPNGPTQAIFVATSLQEAYSIPGTLAIEALAKQSSTPVTWMIGNSQYLSTNAAFYNTAHATNGDDVEFENASSLYGAAATLFPWYTPAVSVEGAGRERNIAALTARGDRAFWGLTWNSHGTDNTSDLGAPWGSFCADPTSYKRPSPSGDCSLVALEWTARDLTRALFTDTNRSGYSAEAAFSSDPDDIILRGGFDPTSGTQYARRLVDAYAAAGATQPIVMMSQQESMEEETRGALGDDQILGAMYDEARVVGMRRMTLRDAAAAAATFSAKPRAIAFPYISGGIVTSYDNVPFAPATIDYHDSSAGMTFVSGHTLPGRVFEYNADSASYFNRALPELTAQPSLTNVAVVNHAITFHFASPQALHYGVALWTDPAILGVSGPNITLAGRAGFVAAFDLPAGESDQTIACDGCTSATFPFSR